MYFFFLRVELGCFSFIPNEAISSARFYEDLFPLDHTCFMPTSHCSYCMSRVLRRKSLNVGSTMSHSNLFFVLHMHESCNHCFIIVLRAKC